MAAEHLSGVIRAYWRIPEREGRAFLKAVCVSHASRAVTLRHQLALAHARFATVQGPRELDREHLFATVATPRFMMELVHDLYILGTLTAPQAAVIEECLLAATDARGQWRPV